MVDLLNLEWLAEASKKTLQAIRNFAHTLRRGPRELSVAAFGVLCFMAPKIIELSNQGHLLREWESYLILFYLLGTFSFLWIFLHSWRIAIPILTPPLVPGSVVIKGPGAFGAQDGILFRRLGRESELHKLYDYVLDDAVSVVVLVGESGAGKTSLLRAGLSNLLEEAKIGYVYWEAVPSAPGHWFASRDSQRCKCTGITRSDVPTFPPETV